MLSVMQSSRLLYTSNAVCTYISAVQIPYQRQCSHEIAGRRANVSAVQILSMTCIVTVLAFYVGKYYFGSIRICSADTISKTLLA